MTMDHHEQNHRLLVIDDNPAIHEDFAKILSGTAVGEREFAQAKAAFFGEAPKGHRSVSFELDSAFQGREGLALVQKSVEIGRPYAMAFVDVRMPPGWDGVETIAQIWKIYPELQVVMCTAYSDYSWDDMVQRLGHSDSLVVLKKPFDNIEVLQLAHALTRKWTLVQQAKSRLEDLDRLVIQRTHELQTANGKLRQEISQRAEVETALRVSEERFSKAFYSSPLAMTIQLLHGEKFVEVNESFLRMTGFARDEVIGHTPAELHLWAQPHQGGKLLELVCRQKWVRNHDCTVRTKSGESRHALAFAELFDLGVEPHLLMVAQDVSERVHLETQLRQAQKMEAVGQLAAGVAHDFNNILTIIQGHVSLLRDQNLFPAETDKSLRQVLSAGDRAATLTRQLLAFSRKQMMQRRPVKMQSLLEEISSMLHRLIGEHITFTAECSPELPPIFADPCNVEQVVINLALNSRDAMAQGGRLTIRAEAVQIDARYLAGNPEAAAGQFVCLTVADTGHGMDATTRARVFEPFFTTKEVGKGTGMGLATVYGIIKQHNGWIDLESQVGSGTTFKIFLPVSRSNQPQDPPTTLGPADWVLHGKETILVVEDEAFLREYVQTVLQGYGYRVLLAKDGVEALNVWERERDQIDLLLTDMLMPGGITGKELARKLVGAKPKLKAIYTSGYSLEVLGQDFKLEEIETFLQKPYQSQMLAQTVRRCLDSKDPSGFVNNRWTALNY